MKETGEWHGQLAGLRSKDQALLRIKGKEAKRGFRYAKKGVRSRGSDRHIHTSKDAVLVEIGRFGVGVKLVFADG